jgi:WD40 repeat protein
MSERIDPFVGLAPYGEQDAEWFFGREREIELIVANLRAARLTLLYGGSGVGKSSVLLAGVMPQLRRIQDADREDARALSARRGLALAERPGLAVVMFRDWRDAPLPRLATAIHAAVAEATGNQELEPWDGEEPFADRLREQASQVRTVLVVLDQFEEYFMYHPNEDGPGTLAGELPELLDDIDLRVNFLLGLREDALSRLDRFKGRIPDLFGNYLRLRYLERDAAREAIEKPVEHYNATVRAGRPAVQVEPALVDAVLDGVRAGRLALHAAADQALQAPASTRVETPYLQLVMRQLWAAGTVAGAHEVSVQTLERLGGAAQIVSNHLGRAMERLSEEDQAVAADVFGFLVTPSRTKIAHAAEDLAVWAGRSPEHVARVLRDLAASDRWVLRAVPPTSEEDRERYELYHDVLADAVHDWASRNQERRRMREMRRDRLRRWRRRGLLGFAWVVCAALAIALVARLGDDEERARAVTAGQLAASSKAALETDPERSVLLGLAALDRDGSSAAAVAALRNAVMDSRLRAAYPVGGVPRPCRFGCDELGPDGTRKSVAVSLPVGSSVDAFDPGDDHSMSVSPSGTTVAIVRRGRVKLWEPGTGLARDLPGASRVSALAFVGVHGRLLLTTTRGDVLVADTRREGPARKIDESARLAAASTDGRFVATAHRRGRVRVRDLRTGEHKSVQPARVVTSLAFNPTDAGELAVDVYGPKPPHRGQGVSLVRWRSGEIDGYIPAKGYYFADSAAEFRPDGRRLLVQGGDRARVYDTASLREVKGGAKQLGSDVHWLGSRLMSVTGNVVNLPSTRWTTALGGHQDPVRDVAMGASLLATGSDDGTARIWDPSTGNQMLELRVAADEAVTQVAFTPSGEFLVTATEGGSLRLWDVAMGSPLAGPGTMDARFGGNESVVGVDGRGRITRWSALDGRRLRTGRSLGRRAWFAEIAPEAGKLLLVDRREKLVIRSIAGSEKARQFPLTAFEFSPDGTHLLLFRARPTLVDLAGHEPVRFGHRQSPQVFEGAISADNRKVFIGGRRQQIFDVASPERPVRLDGADRRQELSGAFDPYGTRLVTTGADAVVWDTGTGELVKSLTGHRGPVTSVSYSPDGKWIITGGVDRTVRLWDGETGKAAGVFRGFRDAIDRAELDPSDHYLLVETEFDEPQVLSCTACGDANELERLARRSVTRALTADERSDAGLTP